MEKLISELKTLLLRNSPILFTGSGFSKFAKTKDGKDLPDGQSLKDKLLTSLLKLEPKSTDYKELMNSTLSDICDYCIQERTPLHLTDLLLEIYSSCKPANFHKSFTKYQWKKIYTTNIDDVLENSFDPNKLNVQNLNRPKVTESMGRIEYLKLHGCVRNPSAGFVFSSRDYIDSMMKSRDYRFNQFGQDIQFEDFVFVGTDNNEINLDYYLQLYESSIGSSSKGRLIFINPYPSLIFKAKVKKIGGKLIEWTTEQFGDFLEKEILNTSTPMKKIESDIDGFYILNNKVANFSKIKDYHSDLYLGYEPKWLDIYFDWDFINEKIQTSFDAYRYYLERHSISKSVYCLVGKSLIGKSVYLKRLSHTLYQDDFEVIEFRGKRFDVFSLVKYAQESPKQKFCLCIDNASYYYGTFRQLMSRFPKQKTLIIITSSRPFFHSRKVYNLMTGDFQEHYIDYKLEDVFANTIESKLEEKGFLGELRKYEKSERIDKIKANNDISSVLFSITYGRGFYRRFNENIKTRFNHLDAGKEILVMLSIFHQLDLGYLPLELITLIYQTQTKMALKEVDDFSKSNEYNGIELRNTFLAKSILGRVPKTQIINNIKEILVTISPQVTEGLHSYWNEMHATLIKEKLLRKRLGLTTNEIKNLLFGIQQYYSDNYNYWIQVGIAEQMENDFDKALNHFKQAESLSPNSYMVKNAIARNFLKQANSQKDHNYAQPYFEEGEKLIQQLIENREEFQVKAFSTHCYLYEKINYLRKFKIAPSNTELKRLFNLLTNIIEKTPEDGMARHISNHFYNYLKENNRTNIINIRFHDLSKLKTLFEHYNIDIDAIFEDFEIDE